MSKYGLQLRVKPAQQKQPARPPRPTLRGFQDDDDDNVEREISRQASKNKSLKDIEEQHKKALEEDPSVFDYDGVYDDIKEKVVRPRAQDREERKPKYIENLLKKAQEREREREVVFERKLAKERSKDDHIYADKDKFVTSAYKKKLAEQAKWMEEERLRQLREEKDDVTKKSDLSDFYFNLERNVAFGAKKIDSRRPENQAEPGQAEKHKEDVAERSDKHDSLEFQGSASEPSVVKADKEDDISTVNRSSEPSDAKPGISSSATEETSVQQPLDEQPKHDHHKRNEDAVAAAKERFLARKKAKEQ